MNILEVKHLRFSYFMQEKESLCGVDISIEEGKFYVICGRSGSGKSTLLRHFKTELAPHGQKQGEILYCGTNIEEVSGEKQCSEIGYVFQNPDTQIVTDKVWHEMAFGLESLGYDSEMIHLRVAEMASYFGIQNWFWKDISELSGGQKQLLNLASVMVMHPKVLLLDEPTSQLDPIAASEFLHTVHRINAELGVTVLLTEHRLEDAVSWADSILVMEEGKLIAQGNAVDIGRELRKSGNEMFLAMTSPMRIYAATESRLDCPYTVAMGRQWLAEELRNGSQLLSSNGATFNSKHDINVENGQQKTELSWENPPVTRRQGNSNALSDIICIKDIWFRYERDLPDVVQGLSLKIKSGEIFALMGGNGAGKSTTLRLLAGILSPYRGKIYLDGRPLTKYSEKELYQGMLGVLPQDPTSIFVKKTVKEELYEVLEQGVMAEAKPKALKKGVQTELADVMRAEIENMVEFLGITMLLERHPYDLSGGEQQKLALAKILLRKPRVLLLDEPTKGLDAYFKREFGRLLQRLSARGMTIILVSHDIEFCAEYAMRVGLFFEGKVTSVKGSREFFAGNHFYTTAANRMARAFFKEAVTVEDVVAKLQSQDGISLCNDSFTGERELTLKKESILTRVNATLAEESGNNKTTKVEQIRDKEADIQEDQTESFSSEGTVKQNRAFVHRIVVIAVLVALAVAGRAAFFMVPSIKPVAAITIVAAASMGPWQGFLVGALSMLTSNMLFGQGPWTIWQMLCMGLVGLLAGILFSGRKKLWKRRFLCLYGFVSVVLCYGMIMNTASLLMTSYELNAQNLKAMYLSGLPIDLVHAGSTVLFLALLGKPMLEQLERVKKKML